MKIFKTIRISLLVLIIILAIIGISAITVIKRSSLPQYKGELSLAGLNSDR